MQALGKLKHVQADSMPIILVQYNPLASIRDTAILQRNASEVWRALRQQIDTFGLQLVLLRATDRTALGANELGVFDIAVERRSDGKWYARGDSVALEPERPSHRLTSA